jgi:hypothetical protein
MNTDKNGRSTCPPGQEQYEEYIIGRKGLVQYDYRTPDGKLFSTVAPSLERARSRRDAWLDVLAVNDPTRLYSKPVNRKYKEQK